MAALDRGAPEPAPPSYAGLAGTYEVIVRTGGETRSMTGTWTVTLGTDGSIALVPPAALDGLTGDGETYSMSSRTFTTNVLIGWPGCQSTALTVGTYRVDVTDRGASFTRVADDCPARITLFGGGLGAAAVTAGRRRATAALGALTAASLVLAGCTGDGSDPEGGTGDRASDSGAFYSSRPCPDDVASAIVGTAECGTLTVPESRGSGGDRTVEALVVTVTPPEITAPDPILVVGADLATSLNYAGVIPVALRTGHRVVFLEQRGTSHSVPSLGCPPADDVIELVGPDRLAVLARPVSHSGPGSASTR